MSAKIITKIIVVCFISVFLSLAGLCYYLNQPKFLASIALKLLNKNPSTILYKEITLESIHWSFWDKSELTNLHIKCKIKGVDYFFSAGHMDLDNLKGLLGFDPLFIEIRNLAVISDFLNISDLNFQGSLYFDKLHYKYSKIRLEASQLQWNQYSIEDIKSELSDQEGKLLISSLQGLSYGGLFQGKGQIQYKDTFGYDLHLQLKDVNTSLIAQVNQSFEQLSVVVTGALNIQSSKDKGLLIQADMGAPLGGSMKASLLRYLAQYVPQRQQIEDLIVKDADVSLSQAKAEITSTNRENISSTVRLNTSSLNLNLKVKFDIRVEGGIESLLEYRS